MTALSNLSVRPLNAINLIRDMLKVTTEILPMSEHPSDLVAITQSGELISGETNIDELPEVPKGCLWEPKSSSDERSNHGNRTSRSCVLAGPEVFSYEHHAPVAAFRNRQKLWQNQR